MSDLLTSIPERLGRQTTEQVNRIVDISRVFHKEFDKWKPIYNEIEMGYNWLGGEQYDDEEKEWYKNLRRPTNVFNLLFPHVNTVMGDFLENDNAEHVFPMGQSDPQIASTLRDLLDNVFFNNDIKSLDAETLLAALVKMGWTYTRYSNEREIGGSVVISNIDEFEIMFDSRAKDYYIDDAKYLIRSRWLTTDDILSTWPHHRAKLKDILMDRRDSAFWTDMDEEIGAMMDHHDFTMEVQGKYRVLEFHEMKYSKTQVAYDPVTRQKYIVDYDKNAQKVERFLAKNPQFRIIDSTEKIKYISNIIPGLAFECDHKKADIQDKQFDYQPLFAYHYGKKSVNNFGIFKNSFGPQKEFNEWHNRTADIINKQSNQTIGFKPSSLLNPREVENQGSMTGGVVKFTDDADPSRDYLRYDPPTFPTGTDVMSREALDLIPKILGITPNQMGFSENKQEPASLFGMKVRQATKALSVIYNNLSRTKQRRSNKILTMLQYYYDTPHIFNVLIKDNMTMKRIEINIKYGEKVLNDITVGKFQVVFDDKDRNPTARALRWELKNQLVQIILNSFGPTAVDPEWWLKEADLGDVQELIDRINQSIMGMVQQGQEMEAMDAADRIIDAANKRGIPLQQGSAQNKPTNTRRQPARQN